MNETQIESLLHQAPCPPVLTELKRQLLADIRLPRTEATPTELTNAAPFWRRWFPALSFGLLFLGCLIVLGMQTSQLFELRRENEGLRTSTANLEQLRQENAELQQLRTAGQEAERLRKENEELLRLRAEVAELRDGAKELTTLRAENQRLQAERAAAAARAGITPEEDPFAQAKEKSVSIQCISNIKQIGLAARMWAHSHKSNVLPSDFLTIRKELNTPKVLTCPADTARTRANSWDQFDGTSVTYELPSIDANELEPYTVYTRCPIHGNIGLTDGSAQMVAPNMKFITVDGKVKLSR